MCIPLLPAFSTPFERTARLPKMNLLQGGKADFYQDGSVVGSITDSSSRNTRRDLGSLICLQLVVANDVARKRVFTMQCDNIG